MPRVHKIKNELHESWRKGVRLNRWFESLTLYEQRDVLKVRRANAASLTATWNAMTDEQKAKVMNRNLHIGLVSRVLISDNSTPRYSAYLHNRYEMSKYDKEDYGL